MRRRESLTQIVGATTIFGLSGCMGLLQQEEDISDSDGDGVIDSKDYAPNDPEVQEKSDVQGSNVEDEQADSTPSANEEERQKILEVYNTGVSKTNAGTQRLDSAIGTYNDEDYKLAMERAGEAKERYVEAEKKYSKAVDLCLQIGHQEALNICDEGQRYALKMQLASQYSQIAAEEADNGNMNKANDFSQKHRDEYNEARELTVRNPSALKSVLNL